MSIVFASLAIYLTLYSRLSNLYFKVKIDSRLAQSPSVNRQGRILASGTARPKPDCYPGRKLSQWPAQAAAMRDLRKRFPVLFAYAGRLSSISKRYDCEDVEIVRYAEKRLHAIV